MNYECLKYIRFISNVVGKMCDSSLVVLFKAEKTEANDDPYVDILSNANLNAAVIPAIAFKYINDDILQTSLNDADEFSGIIFTSPRAVEAVYQASKNIRDFGILEWKKKMNFSVGESTCNLARTLMDMDTLGKDAGNSEKLCQIILSSCQSYSKPFLFPCSNKRKETIPEVLSQHDIQVKEIVCYETTGNPSLTQCWKNVVSAQGLPGILVFFSPSSVEYSHQLVKEAYSDSHTPRYIAIGPSTKLTLHKFNMDPCGVAKKPTPQDVLNVVKTVING